MAYNVTIKPAKPSAMSAAFDKQQTYVDDCGPVTLGQFIENLQTECPEAKVTGGPFSETELSSAIVLKTPVRNPSLSDWLVGPTREWRFDFQSR